MLGTVQGPRFPREPSNRLAPDGSFAWTRGWWHCRRMSRLDTGQVSPRHVDRRNPLDTAPRRIDHRDVSSTRDARWLRVRSPLTHWAARRLTLVTLIRARGALSARLLPLGVGVRALGARCRRRRANAAEMASGANDALVDTPHHRKRLIGMGATWTWDWSARAGHAKVPRGAVFARRLSRCVLVFARLTQATDSGAAGGRGASRQAIAADGHARAARHWVRLPDWAANASRAAAGAGEIVVVAC